MMYRDWREVTKTLLSQHSKNPSTKLAPSMVAKNKMRRKETVEYVRWVIREIERDPRQFDGFTRGHGIIRTRERFLREFEGGGGVVRGVTDKEDGVKESEEEGERKDVRWVVVPVAIPGCGTLVCFEESETRMLTLVNRKNRRLGRTDPSLWMGTYAER